MTLSPGPATRLQQGLTLRHLRLMSALADTGQVSLAAAQIGIAQPAASRLLAEIERIVGQPLHQRTGRGMVLTPAGQALALRAARIQTELRDAARDIAEAALGGAGHVRIGSVTGPAIDRVLPVLQRARLTTPQVTFEVIVAPSDTLCEHLLAGRIDFAIGRLPDGPTRAMFTMKVIATEPVALVVRRDHPLTRHPAPGVQDLLAYDWVMPPQDSLLTRTVLQRLAAHGAKAPQQRLSTASFLLTFALLLQSDAIAPLARAVAISFADGPHAPYVLLPVDLGLDVEAFGLVTRTGSILPSAADMTARQIRELPSEPGS